MDTGKGRFEIFENMPEAIKEATIRGIPLDRLFSVGEEVEVKGSIFRIKAIGTHFMRLELLPKK